MALFDPFAFDLDLMDFNPVFYQFGPGPSTGRGEQLQQRCLMNYTSSRGRIK